MSRPFHFFLPFVVCLLPLAARAQWTPLAGLNYVTTFPTDIEFWHNTFYSADDYGLLRSTNFGQTWQTCVLGPHPMGCLQIAVGTEGIFAGLADQSIWVSQDDGTSWNLACPNPPTGVSQLAVLDGNIFAAGGLPLHVFRPATGQWMPVDALASVTISQLAVHGARVWASTSSGVKYSDDHGDSWQAPTGQLASFSDLMPVGGDTLWALAPNQSFKVSYNNGLSWSPGALGNAGGARRACYDAVHKRFYFTRLSPSPGYLNIWSYTPGAGSKRLTDFQVNALLISANSGVVLAPSYNQALRSIDDGQHWRLETNRIGAANLTIESVLSAQILRAGPALSINAGDSWFQPIDSVIGFYGLRNFTQLGDTLFALDIWASNYHNLYFSVPPYLNWPVRDSSWIFTASDGDLVVQGADLLFIAQSGNGWKLYRSPDRGLNWTFSGNFPMETTSAVVHGNWLMATDQSDQLWRSVDGMSWSLVAQLPDAVGGYELKSEYGQLLANHPWIADEEIFLRSKDDGLSWTKINANLTDPAGLGFDEVAVWGDTLALANELSCWVSLNGGASWIDLTDNLSSYTDLSNLLFYQGSLLRSGTPNYVHSLENVLPVRAAGTVYLDQNHNGVRDTLEPPLSNQALKMRRSGSVRLSAADGTFLIAGTASPDTVEVNLPVPYGVVSPAFAAITDTLEGLEFGVWYPPGQLDRRISLVAIDPFRPGFPTRLRLHCSNIGTADDPATIRLTLPAGLELLSTNPNPDLATNDSIRWEIPGLAVFGQTTFQLTVKTASSVPLNTVLPFVAQVGPINGDLQPGDNVDTSFFTVVGAYDPNDKQVNQDATITPDQLADGRSFHYTVRFENTGTFPAERVRIVDTLATTLDPASFQLLAASHAVQVSLHHSHVLEFLFDTIGLAVNGKGSIQFALRPRLGLTNGDQISNAAAIYFDYNLPVLTNTSLVQVEGMVPVKESGNILDLLISPNPAAGRFTVDLPDAGKVDVFDAFGRLLFTRMAAAGRLSVEGNHWPPGIYTVAWYGPDSRRMGKVILQ